LSGRDDFHLESIIRQIKPEKFKVLLRNIVNPNLPGTSRLFKNLESLDRKRREWISFIW